MKRDGYVTLTPAVARSLAGRTIAAVEVERVDAAEGFPANWAVVRLRLVGGGTVCFGAGEGPAEPYATAIYVPTRKRKGGA